MHTHIREVMTADPLTVPVHTSIAQVARIMRDRGTGDVLVTDGRGILIGIVTDRDIVTRAVATGYDLHLTSVEQIATPAPVAVQPDTDPALAVALMREHAIRRLPVMDAGAIVGVVSLGDLAIDRDENSVLAAISSAASNK
jgi:CBS domain-containing protein